MKLKLNRRMFIFGGLGLVAAVITLILIFSSSGPCMGRFLKAFGHPLFLVKERNAFFVKYDLASDRIVSAEYKLSPAKVQAVEKEEETADPFKCATNTLIIKFADRSGRWSFADGPEIDGRPDWVDGYKFAHLPKRVQEKLLTKFRKAVKYLTKELEREIGIHFKVEKPR